MSTVLLQLFWASAKIGLLAFGGGNTAIPLLEAEAVPGWVSQEEFGELVGMNFALPGVSILKLIGMIGLRVAGIPGMLVAILGIASPGLLLTIGAYSLISRYREYKLVKNSLLAMQYAAVALLASSALRLMQTASDKGLKFAAIALVVGLFYAAHTLKMAPAFVVVVGVLVGMWIL